MIDYYDSAEDVIITKQRALQELRSHGVGDPDSIADFYRELGDREQYDAQKVLDWLGY